MQRQARAAHDKALLTSPFCQAMGLHSRSLRPPHTLQVNWTSRERRGSCRSILTAPSSPALLSLPLLSLPLSLPPSVATPVAALISLPPMVLADGEGLRSSSLELSTSAALAACSCCGCRASPPLLLLASAAHCRRAARCCRR